MSQFKKQCLGSRQISKDEIQLITNASQSGASERVSSASERANGRASGPVLTSLFLFVPDHSALVRLPWACLFRDVCPSDVGYNFRWSSWWIASAQDDHDKFWSATRECNEVLKIGRSSKIIQCEKSEKIEKKKDQHVINRCWKWNVTNHVDSIQSCA